MNSSFKSLEKENDFSFQNFGKGKFIFVSKICGDYFVIFKLLMLNLQIENLFLIVENFVHFQNKPCSKREI
jgi:hypothetical protein